MSNPNEFDEHQADEYDELQEANEHKGIDDEAVDEQESLQQDPEVKIIELEMALAAAQAEAVEQKDKALRIAAEAENTRRRALQDVEKAKNFALEKFASELLEVIDNLERALLAVSPQDEALQAFADGVKLTHTSFLNTVQKFGVEVINPENAMFDPQLHQAMSMQESADVAPNTVLAVMQKGYSLNGRLLRPAMVMVSRAPTEGIDTQA